MATEASFCHVFLSFRGETRNKFTCFLYDALKAEGYAAFMDNSDIRVGDGVDLRIKEGIKNSMSAIIIFSQKYAYSAWCLDELVLILERYRTSRYFIIPIFYEVEIKDIKYQLGNYGLALEHHMVNHKDKVAKWREALVEVGSILGDHVIGLQTTFIQKTVKMFGERLAANFPDYRLPVPRSTSVVLPPAGSSSSPLSRHEPPKNKVIIYTGRAKNAMSEALNFTKNIKQYLMLGNVAFEERNCSKEPKYMRELEELVGREKVRFPMVIVNGKDLCGDEEVEGLDDFGYKEAIRSMLKLSYITGM